MKNKERIMAIIDEIKSLHHDSTTERLVDSLRERVEWAYERAEKCDLDSVLMSIGHYNWLGGLYRGLKRGFAKESGLPSVFDKIEDKIHDAEYLLVNDLVEILETKCGCKKNI